MKAPYSTEQITYFVNYIKKLNDTDLINIKSLSRLSPETLVKLHAEANTKDQLAFVQGGIFLKWYDANAVDPKEAKSQCEQIRDRLHHGKSAMIGPTAKTVTTEFSTRPASEDDKPIMIPSGWETHPTSTPLADIKAMRDKVNKEKHGKSATIKFEPKQQKEPLTLEHEAKIPAVLVSANSIADNIEKAEMTWHDVPGLPVVGAGHETQALFGGSPSPEADVHVYDGKLRAGKFILTRRELNKLKSIPPFDTIVKLLLATGKPASRVTLHVKADYEPTTFKARKMQRSMTVKLSFSVTIRQERGPNRITKRKLKKRKKGS